jgi:beta-glucuronidase
MGAYCWRLCRAGLGLGIVITLALLVPRGTTLPAAMSQSVSAPDGFVMPFAVAASTLNGEWLFAVDVRDVGRSEGWADHDYDDSGWRTETVPHTWGVMAEYADYDGIAWYRRRFTLPAETVNGHVRLRFDAVFYAAHVWLNGEYLGEHQGGYTPFGFDVSAVVDWSSENVVAVRVDNRRATDRIPATLREGWSFDWWNWGGIVRNVSLEITNPVYIVGQRVTATPHLIGMDEADRATIETTVTVRNLSSEALEGTISGIVLDPVSGNSVLATPLEIPVRLVPGASANFTLPVEIQRPKLWHFDHPRLYRWASSLQDANGDVLHTYETAFGIRLVELKDARFYLNGEPMRLVGLTRHADSPQHGLAETVTVMAQDYNDLKLLNMVFSRPVHYPQHEFILDYCDRNGILLIPEVPAWQLTRSQMADEEMRDLEKQQLREMIDAAFNHPSVWAWSVGNEYESKTREGHAFTRDMIDFVKSVDPTRPVGLASNHMERLPAFDATEYADFVMMNQYFGTWHASKARLGEALDDIHATWPDKVVFISEFGFEPRWNDLMGWPSISLNPEEYYILPDDADSNSDEADAIRRQVIREQMEVFRSKPFVAAAIFWTYQDYRTPSEFMMGVVDGERNRRGSWQVLRQEYSPVLIEALSVAPSSDSSRIVAVVLRARDRDDMPSYILRGYDLHWSVTSGDGEETFECGELALPTLEPGEEWSGSIVWSEVEPESVLTLRIVRPTGFEVLERTYDSKGQQVKGE